MVTLAVLLLAIAAAAGVDRFLAHRSSAETQGGYG